MLNVFHHLSDVAAFLREVERCLVPGGRILIVDQHPGWLSTIIYRHLHDEGFDPDASDWRLISSGPLSGANGALAWIVFQRDRHKLADVVPRLHLESYNPHTPLRYWMAGGLKTWSLLPGWAFGLASRVDRALMQLSKDFGSFVDVELVKTARQTESRDDSAPDQLR
jgi:SAM-dependent methyltransferase